MLTAGPRAARIAGRRAPIAPLQVRAGCRDRLAARSIAGPGRCSRRDAPKDADNARVTGLAVLVDRERCHLDDAARIWAEATAARDGDPEPLSGLELAREVLHRALDPSQESLLLIAKGDAGEVLGFAALAPVGGAPSGRRTAELKYIGVQPGAWGRGIGGALLEATSSALREEGFSHAVLEVYVDNIRAIRLYQRWGWHTTGSGYLRPSSERIFVELALEL